MAFSDEFRHLKIQLEEIKLATDSFADNKFIGKGGFGKVYKGQISHSKGRSMVAFKRLDSSLGQGNSEFWKEVMMLSRHTHENLISLVGYCDEGDEKILAYEYASRGSLDRYLGASTLTWTQRLKICVEAARGLSYLHDPKDTQQRVLHRDIKSANILLDENWKAKISDLGLSKTGPANQLHTLLVSNAVGTPGYCDPQYMEMGFLSKESDVYSFGVVLFEVLCGRLCFRYNNGQWEILVRTWKQSYEQKNMVDIIFQDLMQEMDSSSLKTFSDIAYRCLQSSREERPKMAHVMKELEIALELQEISRGVDQTTKDYEGIIKTEAPSLIYRSKVELEMILSKGILVNGGKTWFSLNKKGEHVEMISAAELSITDDKSEKPSYENSNSRFPEGCYLGFEGRFKTHARTRFLSPGITYTINLVFKEHHSYGYLGLKYKLEGERRSSKAYHVEEREGGWMKTELYQFTSDKRTFDLKIQFQGTTDHYLSLKVEGIEFRPVEKVEDEASEDDKINIQPISELDIDWEQILPSDYEEIIKWAKESMEWTTKKELYSLFCKGFLINDGEEYFSLAKNGKNRYMLSARASLEESEWTWQSLSESRFGEAAYGASNWRFSIVCKIKSQMLLPQKTYACYLVYKITKRPFKFEAPVQVKDEDFDLDDSHASEFWFIYLLSPQTPIIRPKVDQNTHNPSDTPKRKGLPQLRNDGWMEVQVWEFRTTTTFETILMHFKLETSAYYNTFKGLIVQGIELKRL